MRLHFFLLAATALLFLGYEIKAQTPEPIVARAIYTYEHQLDTTKPERYKEDMLLAIGKKASVFTSVERITQIKSIQSQEEAQRAASTEEFPHFHFTTSRYSTPTDYYRFTGPNHFYVKEMLVRPYLYEDEFPNIVWKLLPGSTEVAGYQCNTATCTFKGRTWMVAYTKDLPFSTGPWKLGGLPGLIVKAIDSRNQVSFTLKGFEVNKSPAPDKIPARLSEVNYMETNTISLPPPVDKEIKMTVCTYISRKEADRLHAALKSDPKGFFDAQLKLEDAKPVPDIEGLLNWRRRPLSNNPLELN